MKIQKFAWLFLVSGEFGAAGKAKSPIWRFYQKLEKDKKFAVVLMWNYFCTDINLAKQKSE